MKAAYVRPGGPLFPQGHEPGGVARATDLQQFFWDATDPTLPQVLGPMRAEGWKVGTTRDPNWTQPYPTAEVFAGLLSADIQRLAGPGVQHGTIADVEAHNPTWILAMLQAFRRFRPQRYLYWTCEGLQGGWFTPELVTWINDDPFTWVVPQCYYGEAVNPPGRRPISERAILDDLAPTMLHDAKIKTYRDRYEAGWDGVLFDWANIAPHL